MERKGSPESQEGHWAVEASLDHEELAKLFIATAQGDVSIKSCVVQDGQLLSSEEAIGRRWGPNLAIVAQLLRATTPLPDVIEQWLVSLFDQHKTAQDGVKPWEASTCRIKEIRRRRRGRPRNPRYTHWVNSLPDATRIAVEALKSDFAEVTDNLTMLGIALANVGPLSAENRTWLADVFDPYSTFDFQVNARTFVRRNSGTKPIGPNPNWFGWAAGAEFEKKLQNGVLWKEAKWEIAREYKKSEAHVEIALQFWRIREKVRRDKQSRAASSSSEGHTAEA